MLEIVSLNSVGGTEWSSSFQVIGDISILSLGGEGELVLFSKFTLNLAVDILHIVDAERFTFLVVKVFSSLGSDLLESVVKFLFSSSVGLRVQHSQHFVIVFIDVELHWMLVVGEKSVVTIGQISKSASLKNAKSY